MKKITAEKIKKLFGCNAKIAKFLFNRLEDSKITPEMIYDPCRGPNVQCHAIKDEKGNWFTIKKVSNLTGCNYSSSHQRFRKFRLGEIDINKLLKPPFCQKPFYTKEVKATKKSATRAIQLWEELPLAAQINDSRYYAHIKPVKSSSRKYTRKEITNE
jgi:hypothetical protein